METFNFEHELLCIQEKLLNFAIALTHNPTYAWDLVQETNVKILENRNKFESHYYPIKIGYTFIKNLFISDRRKIKQLQEKAIILDPQDQYKIEGGEPVQINYDYNYILEVLNLLDNQSRKIIKLLIEGKRYAEISEILNIPEGTVKSQIHRIREQLKQSLAELLETDTNE